MTSARSAGDVCGQGPSSNALRAADGAVLEDAEAGLPVARGASEVVGATPRDLRLHLGVGVVVRDDAPPRLAHPLAVVPLGVVAVAAPEVQWDPGEAVDLDLERL